MKYKIYLDDERIPNDKTWIVVRNYDQNEMKMAYKAFNDSNQPTGIGGDDIIGYVNSFLKHTKKKQTAELKVEPFTVKNK